MDKIDLSLPDSLGKDTRQVQNDLSLGAQAGLELAAALNKARKAAKALAVTSAKVKRVLAGFDEINRLGETKKASGGGSSRKKSAAKQQTPAQPQENVPQEVSPQLQTVNVESLPAIFSKLVGLTDAVKLLKQLGDSMLQLWQTVLVPFRTWVSETLIPAIGEHFCRNIENTVQCVIAFGQHLQTTWQGLYTGASLVFQGIASVFTLLGEAFMKLVSGIFTGSGQIGSSADEMNRRFGSAAGNLLTTLTALKSGWDVTMQGLRSCIGTVASGVVTSLQSVIGFLTGGFTKSWRQGFVGLKEPVKGIVNSIIGFLNRMLSGLTGAINGVIHAANRLKFTVPDWVPGIGGKQYGFSLKTVAVPQIPYLARGAVLPANQPFLAVVGDQKRGTNVEAPLATIQEAVAAVMADHTAGNMAGHEATVAVLRQILEAVLGIDVGEAAIAGAAQSYQLKNAVMRGGGF